MQGIVGYRRVHVACLLNVCRATTSTTAQKSHYREIASSMITSRDIALLGQLPEILTQPSSRMIKLVTTGTRRNTSTPAMLRNSQKSSTVSARCRL